MKDINEFYKRTENSLSHPIVKEFINMNITPKNAVDLGCGAGRDTIYLIKKGWRVLAIDKEDTREIIEKRLEEEELNNFTFKRQEFEEIIIEDNDLLVANFSIPFCNKRYFDIFWKQITESINENRIFCRKLFWTK